jgi:hypothetical protein
MRRWCTNREPEEIPSPKFWALVHESESGTKFSPCLTNWLLHGEGLWPAKFEHPTQNVARDQSFSFLRFGMTRAKPITND